MIWGTPKVGMLGTPWVHPRQPVGILKETREGERTWPGRSKTFSVLQTSTKLYYPSHSFSTCHGSETVPRLQRWEKHRDWENIIFYHPIPGTKVNGEQIFGCDSHTVLFTLLFPCPFYSRPLHTYSFLVIWVGRSICYCVGLSHFISPRIQRSNVN